MKVERKDVFDFTVVLTEQDFNGLKYVAHHLYMSIEAALALCISSGIDKEMNRIQTKEP